MALDSDSAIHILLVGRPASAENHIYDIFDATEEFIFFLMVLILQRPGSWIIYLQIGHVILLVDEIDKMTSKNQAFLLNLMATGIISETKYGKTRSAKTTTSVFATSNNIKNLSAPLRSRFFIVRLGPYTYEQFFEITKQLLSHQKMERGSLEIS